MRESGLDRGCPPIGAFPVVERSDIDQEVPEVAKRLCGGGV
jgi:hypothetical protein